MSGRKDRDRLGRRAEPEPAISESLDEQRHQNVANTHRSQPENVLPMSSHPTVGQSVASLNRKRKCRNTNVASFNVTHSPAGHSNSRPRLRRQPDARTPHSAAGP